MIIGWRVRVVDTRIVVLESVDPEQLLVTTNCEYDTNLLIDPETGLRILTHCQKCLTHLVLDGYLVTSQRQHEV